MDPVVVFAAEDVWVIVGYFVLILYVGFSARRSSHVSNSENFLLGGRTLTLPFFIMTLTSSWYGGILGVGEFSYRYGLANWFVQGFPYYVFALVFALVFARRIRHAPYETIPQRLYDVFGNKAGAFGAALVFMMVTPAPYILMLGVLLHMMLGGSVWVWVIVGTVLSVVYLYKGGFCADVYTDVVEFIFMFVGFAIVVFYCWWEWGGLSYIRGHVPPLHLTLHGGVSGQYIVVWFFIALWTLVDPSFYQRCAAARSARVAQRGIIYSIGFWFVFDAMTATAGLYARAALPDLSDPVMAYPMLAEVLLPKTLKGLFWAGMLATVMSTLNTTAFLSASTLGKDMLEKWQWGPGKRGVVPATRLGLWVVGVIGIVLAIIIPSVISLWYTIGTIFIPGLLLPVLCSYSRHCRISDAMAFMSMLSGVVTALLWLLTGWWSASPSAPAYPLGVEPMYPGLAMAILIWLIGWLTYQKADKEANYEASRDIL